MTRETTHADYTILIRDDGDEELLADLNDPTRHPDSDSNFTGVAWYGILLARHADQPRARQFELASHDQLVSLREVRDRLDQLIAVLES